jgi:hypothetical protein
LPVISSNDERFVAKPYAWEIVGLMINRNFWPSGLGVALLIILPLGPSHKLLACQTGELPSSGSFETPATLGNDAGLNQTQAAPAQAPTPSQAQPAAPQSPAKPANDPAADPIQSATTPKHKENDRIFFALPNYLTVENSASLPPLTTGEKFKTVAEGCFDPVEVVFMGIEAGIGQADNTNPTYGQGFVGYSKRFGTAYADAIVGNFGTGAIFPALLRQDPRYYQLGKGNFLHRFVYAAGRVLVTRSDTSGKTQFNFSELLGNSMAAGVANAYHPGPHTLASNSGVLGTQVLLDALGYELKEFWPDIHRLLLHVHH